MPSRIAFLDVAFDRLDFAQACAWLARRRAGDAFGYVVTPNVDHLVRLAEQRDALLPLYADAALCLCDSRVLARLARLSGVTLPVVPGSDLVAALFADILREGDRVCIVGGDVGGAERLRMLHPALEILHHAPPMGLRDDAAARQAAVAAAAATDARFILLAVGSPQQEMLARELLHSGARGTALCIGAAVDFLVGGQVRAPRLVQRAGMEWAWRLLRDPRRLARRYLIDGPAIFPIVWRWRARDRRQP